jgi:hypothetical protein
MALNEKLMLNSTREIIKAALNADATLSSKERVQYLAVLSRPTVAESTRQALPTENRWLRRCEVARRLV